MAALAAPVAGGDPLEIRVLGLAGPQNHLLRLSANRLHEHLREETAGFGREDAGVGGQALTLGDLFGAAGESRIRVPLPAWYMSCGPSPAIPPLRR